MSVILRVLCRVSYTLPRFDCSLNRLSITYEYILHYQNFDTSMLFFEENAI